MEPNVRDHPGPGAGVGAPRPAGRAAAARRWLRAEFGSLAACAGVLALATLAALFLLSQRLQHCDDAYITFRHARHLAEHLRPAWNLHGPAVLGSSSPAFTLLLGALGLVLGGRVDSLALWLNAALLWAVVVLAWLVARELASSAAWAWPGAALVAFSSVNVFVFSLGFEAALLTAVLLAGLWLVRRGRDLPAVLLASLAPLVRPEGLLLAPLVWGSLLCSRRFRWALVPAFVALPLAWVAFAGAYYGSPVPQSIRSREMRAAIFFPYEGDKIDLPARLLTLGPELASFWNGEASAYLFSGFRSASYRPSGAGGLGWVVALAALPAALVWAWRRRDARVAYLLYAPAFLGLYAWIGYREAWYFPSFVSFALLLLWQGVVVGTRALAQTCPEAWREGPWGRLAGSLVAALAFAALFGANNYEWNGGRYDHKGPLFARDPRGPLFEWAEIERFRTYRSAARLMNGLAPEPPAVLTSEVGVFGFFYRGDVIDTVGLCSPEALRFYPPPHSDIWRPDGRRTTTSNNLTPTAMVMTLKPPYLVNPQAYVRNLLLEGSPFLREYALARKAGTAWGAPLLIFRRLDQPEPPGPQE